jgi:hypothetical protein
MFTVNFEYDGKLDGLDEKIRVAVAAKLTELTGILHNKVIENISGKILQKQSGQLAGSIQQSVDTSNEPMIGFVFPEPASPKAWALEKGGESYYPITPTKAAVLRFIAKSGETVFAKSVNHPPSKEFAYLRLALEEMEPIIPAEFRDAIAEAIAGA